MVNNIFLSKEIAKLTKANKKEILLMIDLVAYLTIANEIDITTSKHYSNELFNMLE